MKLLCTGAAGFLGSHVCELFKSKGWNVLAYDNLTKFELRRTDYNVEKVRQYNIDFLESIGVELVVEDIRDIVKLKYHAKGCDYIINCAAQPAMTIALESPGYDADVNIMGTLNILKVGRDLHIPIAICSTIHVYGNKFNELELDPEVNKYQFQYYPQLRTPIINEDMPLLTGLLTPLHASKYTTELYARAFIESFNSDIFVARLTGIYGERQTGSEDHGWVANFAIRTICEKPIKVFGTDKQCRDILYVKDAAQAFLDWYERGRLSGVYLIGGGVPCLTSIKKCLQTLSDITDKKQNIILEPARPGDLWYFCCDIKKAKQAFDWKPTVLPYDGISRLVDWVKNNQELFYAKALS
jgi:CDP-paratose 2-epimerase